MTRNGDEGYKAEVRGGDCVAKADDLDPPAVPTRLGAGAIVIVPTYNERENLALLVGRIIAAVPGAHLLIVDDNSPDGTGTIADELATSDPRIQVLHRPGKSGLGKAYLAGFHAALTTTADFILEMDADFSHDPVYLPRFLELVQEADVVIGSRYIPGGGVEQWGFHRKLISGLGNSFARRVLGLPAQDCTAGYKCYRRAVIEQIGIDRIRSEGYAFQVEMIYRAHRHGFTIREFPIIFPDRVRGTSKMSKKIIAEALLFVVKARLGLVR